MRFAAPLQSWGLESRFDRRNTERVPTKSGVIGLLAAALGRRREEPVDDLTVLRFGVRIDRPGRRITDFQTAHGKRRSYVTYREYLSDAVFLVGLEGNEEQMRSLQEALMKPYFPLYLGRRSCPPEGKILIGLREGVGLEEALRKEPPLSDLKIFKEAEPLRVIVEASAAESVVGWQKDEPISFARERRQYGYRPYTEFSLQTTKRPTNDPETNHDPIGDLGGRQ